MDENLNNPEVIETNTLEDAEVLDDVKSDSDIPEEKTYTQADIDALQAQIDELAQYKPQELSEQEIKLQEKSLQLWQKQVDLELKEQGLEVFKDFIRVDVDDTDALNTQITKLKEIVGTLELSNGYQPTNYKPVDAYSIAKKGKNVKDMISAKLNS